MSSPELPRVITAQDLEIAAERLRARDVLVDSAIASGDDSLVTDPADRGRLASRLGGLGEWDKAEAVARAIDDRAERAESLALLAQRLAEAGLLDRAARIAELVEEDPPLLGAVFERTLALVAIAKGYGRQGESERSSELLRSALQSARLLEGRDWVGLDCLVEIGVASLGLGKREEAIGAALEATGLALKLAGQADIENQLVRLGGLLADLQCDREVLEIVPLIRSSRARQDIGERLNSS